MRVWGWATATLLASSCYLASGLDGFELDGAGGSGGAAPSNCPAGFTLCEGACVRTDIDPAHCGGCDGACPQGEVCAAGKCKPKCTGGTTECSGGCVQTSVDPAHCGGCAAKCAEYEVCSAGKCGIECLGGLTRCGDFCVDTDVDPKACGSCAAKCAEGEVCVQGKCQLVCGPGLTNCSGKCVDLSKDVANCGGCGKACGQGQVCFGGSCQAVDIDDFLNWNASFWEGYEWCGNSPKGAWSPLVTNGEAAMQTNDYCWGQIRTKQQWSVGVRADVRLKPLLQSGGENGDHALLVLGTEWAHFGGSYAVGISLFGGKVQTWSTNQGGFGSEIGSYVPNKYVDVTLHWDSPGSLHVWGDLGSATVSDAVLNSKSLYLVFANGDSSDGFYVDQVQVIH